MSVRTRLKTSLSRRLTTEGEARKAVLRLSRGASRRRVEDRDHFWYLMNRYLPDHGGVKSFEDRGWVDGVDGSR